MTLRSSSVLRPARGLRRLFTMFLLSSALLTAGCATGPEQTVDGPPLTPDEQRLRQQADAYNETVIEGAIVGALVGALAGALIGGDARGAAIGAGAGAALGGGAGAYLGQKQRQYSNDEQRLESITADVQADNERTANILASARKVISADKEKIKRIDQQLASGQIDLAQARNQMKTVDDNKAYLETTIANLKTKREQWWQVANQSRGQGNPKQVAEMETEIKEMERQIAALESELDSLVERRRISRV